MRLERQTAQCSVPTLFYNHNKCTRILYHMLSSCPALRLLRLSPVLSAPLLEQPRT
jgi:hypothetical protein